MKTIKNIKKFFLREIKFISKDINIISVILLAPLFYAFFYGSIYINKNETNVGVDILDMDNSAASRKIVRFLDANEVIAINKHINNLEEANKEIISENAKAVIYFPKGFEARLKKREQAHIKVYLNSTRFLVSNDLNKALNEVIGYTNAGIGIKYFETRGNNFEQSLHIANPINVDIRSLFNFTDSYGDFLIPAILILILQQTLLIGLSESIAKERETNSFSKLNLLSGNKTSVLIHGKGSFYFLLYGSYAFFFFTVNFYVFKIPNKGDFLTLFILTGLYLVAVTYTTIFISSFFKSKISALQFLTLTSYPVFLSSGYSWPSNSLPYWLRGFASLIPSTPYYAAFTRVTQMGAQLGDIKTEILHLIILALVAYALSSFRIKYLIKKEQLQINNTINTSLETI